MSIWPFRHAGLKLLSLGLAVLLWLVVTGGEDVERGLRVPLELQQFPSGLELRAEPPTFADVRVRGSSDTLSRLGPGDVVAVLDLRTARPGHRLFQLTPEQVRAPFGVEVMQVSPASVAIVFENSASRRLPIAATVEGEPAPGYVVGVVRVDPSSVEVTGPESAVKEAIEALTEAVSIGGATASVSESVAVGLLDPAVRLKTQRLATVHVEVLPGPRERTLPARPVHLRRVGANLTAQAIPPRVDVGVRGTLEGLGRLQANDVTAFVDLGGLGAGDYSITVDVDPIAGAGVASIDPPIVQVRITGAKH